MGEGKLHEVALCFGFQISRITERIQSREELLDELLESSVRK